MNQRHKGRVGEEIAADYLRSAGFKIVEKNFRCRMGEIDIVARKGKDLYFVEVKLRKNRGFGSPFESITLVKQRQLLKVARFFLSRYRQEVGCHFSVIGIEGDGAGGSSIEFLPDAFEES